MEWTEKILEEIMAEMFPDLIKKKSMRPQIQEAQRTPSTRSMKELRGHITSNLPKPLKMGLFHLD
jgi:hypothetical protein